ncbi:MAG: hypothetical protein Q8R04_04975 [Nanoarchaeota archaeon]|nr:hypothetical protein [Nanoarchaeota archaeon]
METKDLVLLMMIPVILISLVVYIDKPAITGAVTAQQEKSNVIGTYTVNPSFKVNMQYKLEDEYKEISQKLDGIISSCINEKDIRQCFTLKTIEHKWSCEENKIAAVLNDFVDKFNDCLNLADNEVVCRFSFDGREISDRTFTIKLTPENQRIKAELIEFSKTLEVTYINQPDLSYVDYSNKDGYGKPVDSISIVIKYLLNKPEITAAFAEVSDIPTKIDLSKSLFYKTSDGIKFTDIAEEGNFRAPIPANKIIDLPRTKAFKFCAKTNTKFYAYDKSDNTVKLRDVVYKFAVTLPEPVTPPPIKSLLAEDKLKAEKSVVLRWSKVKHGDGSEVSDFDHYNIYCSKNPLQDKNTKDINLYNLKPTIAVKSNINYDAWLVDLSICEKEPIEENFDYYFAVTAVSAANKESKAIVQASAKSVDDLAPGVQRIVLVNSDNVKEEKISSACINLPVEKDNRIGNIWVGFFMPEKNEDEITDVRADEQLTYLLHFSKQIPASNLGICSRYKCIELNFAPNDKVDYAPERTFHKHKEFENPNTFFAEDQTYCFTIVAKDKNGNMLKSLPYNFIKPQQWVDFESKPVMKGFFNDKGDINYP